MNNFDEKIKKTIGTNLVHWYKVWNEKGKIKNTPDSNKQKYGRIAEVTVQVITESDKDVIKDFKAGELKAVSLKRCKNIKNSNFNGSESKFLNDNKNNLLTYYNIDNDSYCPYKPYGDNFIAPYYAEMTSEHFDIKTGTMYYLFYDKYQPNGFEIVENATIVNILKFESSNYKNLKKEFEFIKKKILKIDLMNKTKCDKVTKEIRNANDLLIIKRFKNGKNYQWQFFFKDKQVIKYGEFLADYKTIVPYNTFYSESECIEHIENLIEESNYDLSKINKNPQSSEKKSAKCDSLFFDLDINNQLELYKKFGESLKQYL